MVLYENIKHDQSIENDSGPRHTSNAIENIEELVEQTKRMHGIALTTADNLLGCEPAVSDSEVLAEVQLGPDGDMHRLDALLSDLARHLSKVQHQLRRLSNV